jgi:hypothetical protein
MCLQGAPAGRVGSWLVRQLTGWHQQKLSKSNSVLLLPSAAAAKKDSSLRQWMQQQFEMGREPVQIEQQQQLLAGLRDGRPAAAVFLFSETAAAAGRVPFTSCAMHCTWEHSPPADQQQQQQVPTEQQAVEAADADVQHDAAAAAAEGANAASYNGINIGAVHQPLVQLLLCFQMTLRHPNWPKFEEQGTAVETVLGVLPGSRGGGKRLLRGLLRSAFAALQHRQGLLVLYIQSEQQVSKSCGTAPLAHVRLQPRLSCSGRHSHVLSLHAPHNWAQTAVIGCLSQQQSYPASLPACQPSCPPFACRGMPVGWCCSAR